MPLRNLTAIFLSALVSLVCWQTSRQARQDDEIMELYGLFVDAVEQVESRYVNEVDRRELLENALRGMLSELDPYSSFIDSSQIDIFQRQIQGSFGGVGISVEIDPDSNRLRVVAPLFGTPAYEAGVMAGDVIMAIDGTPTANRQINELTELMQGRPGTDVILTVVHPGREEPTEIAITRAIIEVPSIIGDTRGENDLYDWIVDDEHQIALLRISNFVQSTAEDLRGAIDEALGQGSKAIVLDLRGNPGGLLDAAVNVSNLFIKEGRIVSTKGRNAPERVYDATPEQTFDEIPLAILIDGGSASASEIVAACLQDNERATIIGSRSFGKGSVQNIIDLEDGRSVLKLTVATYRRPSGENIHRFPDATAEDEWGVTPEEDFLVELTPEEYRDWIIGRRQRDRTLGAARGKDAPTDNGEQIEAEDDPFQDRVLERALEHLISVLDPDSAKTEPDIEDDGTDQQPTEEPVESSEPGDDGADL